MKKQVFTQFQVFRNGVSVGFTKPERGPTKVAAECWLKEHTIGGCGAEGKWRTRGEDGWQYDTGAYQFDFERPQG